MPRKPANFCRNCGAPRDKGGSLSRSDLCAECGHRLLEENIDGMKTKSGRPYARWRMGMVASTLREPAHVNFLIDLGEFD